MTEMNFETDAGDEYATEGELSRIARLVDLLTEATGEVDRLESALKNAKAERDHLSENDIPSAMSAAGLSEVRLTDGRPVRVETGVRASISRKNRDAAHGWLEDHGYGDIVKGEMKINVGRGEVARLSELAAQIAAEHGWAANVDERVHPQTLAAFVRERRAEGDPIPDELLGVYEFQKTKVG